MKAIRVFFEGNKRNDSIRKRSEDAGVSYSRGVKWNKAYGYIHKACPKNLDVLIDLLSLDYGVSEDVLCSWIRAIDKRMEDIKKCGAISNDIRRILEKIGKKVNSHIAPHKKRNY